MSKHSEDCRQTFRRLSLNIPGNVLKHFGECPLILPCFREVKCQQGYTAAIYYYVYNVSRYRGLMVSNLEYNSDNPCFLKGQIKNLAGGGLEPKLLFRARRNYTLCVVGFIQEWGTQCGSKISSFCF